MRRCVVGALLIIASISSARAAAEDCAIDRSVKVFVLSTVTFSVAPLAKGTPVEVTSRRDEWADLATPAGPRRMATAALAKICKRPTVGAQCITSRTAKAFVLDDPTFDIETLAKGTKVSAARRGEQFTDIETADGLRRISNVVLDKVCSHTSPPGVSREIPLIALKAPKETPVVPKAEPIVPPPPVAAEPPPPPPAPAPTPTPVLAAAAPIVADEPVARGRVRVSFRDELTDGFKLQQATVLVDGKTVYDASGPGAGRRDLHEGEHDVGAHEVTVKLVYAATGLPYMAAYKFRVKMSHAFTVEKDGVTGVDIVSADKGFPTAFEERPEIRISSAGR